MKVVVDTNLLVSTLVFPGGAPEQVYRLAIEGRITPVTSPPLLAELGRVLTQKLCRRDDYLRAAFAQIVRIREIVEPLERVSTIADDPDDDRVLEAAQAAGASLIVSGDRHLLNVGHCAGRLRPAGWRPWSGRS